MLEEQHPDAVLVSPSGEPVLGHEALRAHTSKNTDVDRQGAAALTVSAAHPFGEGNGAEPAGSRAPLSDEALDTVQGGISGAGIGGLAGGTLGVVGVGVLAVGSGVVAVASAPVLIAGAVVGGVAAGIGAGVGALVDWAKGN
jgi:hypothetical protein